MGVPEGFFNLVWIGKVARIETAGAPARMRLLDADSPAAGGPEGRFEKMLEERDAPPSQMPSVPFQAGKREP
jgi:hypothetical protein